MHTVNSPKDSLGLHYNSDFSGSAHFVSRNNDTGEDVIVEVDAKEFLALAEALVEKHA
jgi:hypothetical protein